MPGPFYPTPAQRDNCRKPCAPSSQIVRKSGIVVVFLFCSICPMLVTMLVSSFVAHKKKLSIDFLLSILPPLSLLFLITTKFSSSSARRRDSERTTGGTLKGCSLTERNAKCKTHCWKSLNCSAEPFQLINSPNRRIKKALRVSSSPLVGFVGSVQYT